MRARAILFGMALAAGGCTTLDDQSCPPDSKLTYESFGKGFFERECVWCHGGAKGQGMRSFTTVESIRSQKERIFVNAAADNRAMPPGPDGPSDADRQRLAEWLACGAP